MAKNISKSVIEDIAYELKNAGMWILSSEEDKRNGVTDSEVDYTDPHLTLDSLASSLGDVLMEYDPTFNREKWNKQTSYRILG
jgi:predicted peptidase